MTTRSNSEQPLESAIMVDFSHEANIDFGTALHHAVDVATSMMEQTNSSGSEISDMRNFLDDCNGRISVGMGSASGEHRAENAAESALSQLFPEIAGYKNIPTVVISICGSADMTMEEYSIASKAVLDRLSDETNVLLGTSVKEGWQDRVQVTLLCGGLRIDD